MPTSTYYESISREPSAREVEDRQLMDVIGQVHAESRGTNENTDGILRQYLPRGQDLSTKSPGDLQQIADELNSRLRKALDWDTPSERLNALMGS